MGSRASQVLKVMRYWAGLHTPQRVSMGRMRISGLRPPRAWRKRGQILASARANTAAHSPRVGGCRRCSACSRANTRWRAVRSQSALRWTKSSATAAGVPGGTLRAMEPSRRSRRFSRFTALISRVYSSPAAQRVWVFVFIFSPFFSFKTTVFVPRTAGPDIWVNDAKKHKFFKKNLLPVL